MARKEAGNVATIDDLPPIEPKTQTLTVMIELDATGHSDVSGYSPKWVHVNLPAFYAEKWRLFLQAARGSHATFVDVDGTVKHVDTDSALLRYILNKSELA